jgi:hypothetical protein
MLPLLLAGVIYHFTTTFTDSHGGVSRNSARVFAEGTSYRLELDPASGERAFDIAISRDGDRTARLISHRKKTYYDRVRVSAKTSSSILFQYPFTGGETVGKPIVLHRTEESPPVAGHPATKHMITIEYRLTADYDTDTPVNALVHATQTIWTADDLPRLPFERALTTGWTAVDRDLKPVTDAISGMTIGSELVVTRSFEGGPPRVETTRTVIDELRIEEIPPSMFDLPADYVYDLKPVAPRFK